MEQKESLVPFAVVEVISARHDKTMKRMCVAFVVAICVLAICTTIMCAFWCKSINMTVDANADTIIQQIEELHNEQNGT